MAIEYRGFFDRETMMKQWDSRRKYITEGGGGFWPRDAFEALLDYFEERLSSQQGDSVDAIKPCSNCGSMQEAVEKHCAACWEEK